MNLTNWHKQGRELDHLGHEIDCRCEACKRWWLALFTPLAGGPLEPEPTLPAGSTAPQSPTTAQDELE